MKRLAPLALVLALFVAGCTTEQLEPFRRTAAATTQAANDPLVVAATLPSPVAFTTREIISYIGNATLAALLALENAKKRQAQKTQK